MKYLNKILLALLLILPFFLTGCDDEYQMITCTKNASISNSSASVNVKYIIYYQGSYVKKTISNESITSSDTDELKTYQTSYTNIFSQYKDIEGYTNTVQLNNNTVTSQTTIDYQKVDKDKIIAIEGEDGNIFESDGKVKLSTLLALYKKYGSTCDD